MNERIMKLNDKPNLIDRAAEWFHEKWKIPKGEYLKSMEASLSGDPVQAWYLCLDGDKIVAGAGVIPNDFHNRPDLAPNVCAVYTELEYRNQGIAGRLLDYIVADNKARGISPLLLLTDHVGFYEHYGWEFFCMVQGDHDSTPSRMYLHR